MDEHLSRLCHDWLIKALHDLKSAYIVGRDPEGPLDTAIYHCQQVAEKALKGWLIWMNIPFEKAHDLTQLAKLAATRNPSLQPVGRGKLEKGGAHGFANQLVESSNRLSDFVRRRKNHGSSGIDLWYALP